MEWWHNFLNLLISLFYDLPRDFLILAENYETSKYVFLNRYKYTMIQHLQSYVFYHFFVIVIIDLSSLVNQYKLQVVNSWTPTAKKYSQAIHSLQLTSKTHEQDSDFWISCIYEHNLRINQWILSPLFLTKSSCYGVFVYSSYHPASHCWKISIFNLKNGN